MSTSTQSVDLWKTLLQCEAYSAIPDQERTACAKLMAVVGQARPEPPLDSPALDAEYEAALEEARGLMAKGKLSGVMLPDAAQEPGVAKLPASGPPNSVDGPEHPPEAKTPDQTPPPPQSKSDIVSVQGLLDEQDEGTRQPSEPTGPLGDSPDDYPEYPAHPEAKLLPMMSNAELQALAADIEEHGLREPIWLFEDQIADGRNRFQACKLAGVKPRFREWQGEGPLVDWILSANFHRRHLSDQQRAFVAARMLIRLVADSRARSTENLRQNGGSPDGVDPARREMGRSSTKAALRFNVSEDRVKKAARILRDGIPALLAAVEQETASLDAGAAVATLPQDQQDEVVAAGRIKETARAIRDAKKGSRGTSASEAGQALKAADPHPTPEPASQSESSPLDGSMPEQTAQVEAVSEQTAHLEAVPEQTAHLEAVPEQTDHVEAVPEQTARVEAVPEQTAHLEAVPEQLAEPVADGEKVAASSGTPDRALGSMVDSLMWVDAGDTGLNLCQLSKLLEVQVTTLASRDYPGAKEWLGSHMANLRVIFAAAKRAFIEPAGEEQ